VRIALFKQDIRFIRGSVAGSGSAATGALLRTRDELRGIGSKFNPSTYYWRSITRIYVCIATSCAGPSKAGICVQTTITVSLGMSATDGR